MRLALVTDAWEPQTNGVVTTLRNTCETLASSGIEVLRISPEQFATVPCPSYPEVRLALQATPGIARRLEAWRPDAIHIATEGPLGLAARAWCLARGLRFTTSYHTQFPEYLRARWPIPLTLGYAYMRWFHAPAQRTLVGTETMRRMLQLRGLRRLRLWSRGVDTELFRPQASPCFDLPRPLLMYAGRVAVEKNLDAFLRLEGPGSRVVVGDGPAAAALRARQPGVHFTGMLRGAGLASALAAADVLVFPSRTDTFGLVMLEAMACGVPVAAYPVTGPLDVVVDGVTGALDLDLERAVQRALQLDRAACRRHAETRSWRSATQQFLAALVPVRQEHPLPCTSEALS